MNIPLKEFFKIPFKARGRDWSGCDCWGFVRLVANEHFRLNIPALDENYLNVEDGKEMQELIGKYRGKFRKCEYFPGAIVLINRGGYDCHVGIMINRVNFLHIEKAIGVNMQSTEHSNWKNKILGYYEYIG